MKNKNIIGMMIVAGSMLAATSCSDFSDYNSEPDLSANGGNKSLWENISSNPELSQFASILQRVGYDKVLSASHTYTVWAPKNNSFNYDSVLQVSNAKIEKEFVNSHVTNFSHMETDLSDTTIYMLNKKLVKFSNKNTSNMKFDGRALSLNEGGTYNLPCSNGILYMLNGKSDFRFNGYEYISELKGEAENFMKYVKKYENKRLDTEKSVKGEIINGVQHYDDSVITVTNSFFQSLYYARRDDIYLNNEDSLATLLILNDEAWTKTYPKIASYYKYISPMNYQDLASSEIKPTEKGGTCPTSATGRATIMDPKMGKVEVTLPSPPAGAEISATTEYWQDSIAKRALLNDIVFSHGYPCNKKFVTGEPFQQNDSIMSSTGYIRLKNPDGIAKATKEIIDLSNGKARILNDYPFTSDLYAPVLRTGLSYARKVPSDVTMQQGTIANPSPSLCVLDDDDPAKERGLTYLKTKLATDAQGKIIVTTAPELDFYLEGVLSTTYDIYLVVVPPAADSIISNPSWTPDPLYPPLPYSLRVDINYTDANNTQIAGRFDGTGIQTTIAEITKVPAFELPAQSVDTLKLGRVTFPVCYAGTSSKPNIKVMHTVTTFNSSNKKKYTQELRIANIILRPVEENEQ